MRCDARVAPFAESGGSTGLGFLWPREKHDEQNELAYDGHFRCDGRNGGLMLLSGPWSPRLVEKDPAGTVLGDVGGPPRPLARGTPITPAETSR
jgi:hypothetical protein